MDVYKENGVIDSPGLYAKFLAGVKMPLSDIYDEDSIIEFVEQFTHTSTYHQALQAIECFSKKEHRSEFLFWLVALSYFDEAFPRNAACELLTSNRALVPKLLNSKMQELAGIECEKEEVEMFLEELRCLRVMFFDFVGVGLVPVDYRFESGTLPECVSSLKVGWGEFEEPLRALCFISEQHSITEFQGQMRNELAMGKPSKRDRGL